MKSLSHLTILILYDNDDLVILIIVIPYILKCVNVSNKIQYTIQNTRVAYLSLIKKKNLTNLKKFGMAPSSGCVLNKDISPLQIVMHFYLIRILSDK